MMKKTLIRFMAFVVIIGALFYRVYQVLGYNDNVHTPAVFEQFYGLPKNIVDVVWLGSSSTQEFIIPSEMYEETGMSVYSFSVGNEPFMATKNLILECEKTQDPKVYLVDIRQLAYYTSDDTYVRRISDNMKFSSNRIDAIKYMLGNLNVFHPAKYDGLFDYIFSFTKYHTRWTELNAMDYDVDKDCFFGYWIKTFHQTFDQKEISTRIDTPPVEPPEENIRYLNDFLDFCDTFDKEIIFTRTPNCLDENYFAQYNYIQKFIENKGYEVWDLNRDVTEMGIDYGTDFADMLHTNVYGAIKVSRYAAKIIASKYNLEDHRRDKRYIVYRDMSKKFQEKFQEADLKATTDFSTYLDKLIALDKNEYTVYIAEKDIQGYQLTQEMTDKLKELGFDRADTLLEHVYHSFIGVIANGRMIYQQIGQDDEPGHYEGRINGQDVSIDSMTLKGGNTASIKLGVIEYAKNTRGLNFVVVDNKEGKILDSVAFDTHVPEMTCTR